MGRIYDIFEYKSTLIKKGLYKKAIEIDYSSLNNFKSEGKLFYSIIFEAFNYPTKT
jgi:hypothetical protein